MKPKHASIAALLALLLLRPAVSSGQDNEVRITKLEFREAKVVDVLRLIGEVSDLNVVASEAAGQKKVSLYLHDVTPRAALETICRASGLWFREDPGTRTLRVLTTDEYQKDLVVFREDKIRIFTLQHPNATAVAYAIEDLFGDRVRLSLGITEDTTGFQTYGQNALLALQGGSGTGRNNGGAGGLNNGNALGGGGGAFGGCGFGGGLGGAFGGVSRGGVTGGLQRNLQQRQSRSAEQRNQAPEGLVDEKLTADQIAELERRRAAGEGGDKASVTGDSLRGITRREPPIFVSVNSPHNVIVVRTSDERALDEIERLVRDLDRPTPQVLLEMKILELDLNDDFTSVFDFDFVDGGQQFPGNAVGSKNNPFLAAGANAPRNVLGAGNFDLNPRSTLIYQFLNDRVRARVQLLERENRVHVLSTPLLLCANHAAARIFVGEERPLTRGFQAQNNIGQLVQSTLVVPQTELRDIGTTLIVLPQINADRTVSLTIIQENSTLRAQSATVPVPLTNGGVTEFAVDTVGTSNLSGTVVGKDSMTIAVGGLIEDRIQKTEEKVPFLGDIPILGNLFRSTVRERRRAELILLVTPRVLFTPAEAQSVSRERLLGLSIHPYQDKGDKGSRAYEKHEVPQAERAHVFLRDLFAPDPEPAGK